MIKGLNALQCCSQRSDSSQMILHECDISHLLEQQRLGCWRGLFKGIYPELKAGIVFLRLVRRAL